MCTQNLPASVFLEAVGAAAERAGFALIYRHLVFPGAGTMEVKIFLHRWEGVERDLRTNATYRLFKRMGVEMKTCTHFDFARQYVANVRDGEEADLFVEKLSIVAILGYPCLCNCIVKQRRMLHSSKT